MARVRLALIGMVSIALLGVMLPVRWGPPMGPRTLGMAMGNVFLCL